MGTVAGEMLASGNLEATEASQDNTDPERGRAATDHADHQHHDPGEHGQLGQREVSPGRRRSLVCARSIAQRPQAVRITDIRRRP